MFTELLETLPSSPINAEKVDQMHHQIAPYVPEKFKGDPMYAAPSAEQQSDAKTAKQSRHNHRAAMAVAAKNSAKFPTQWSSLLPLVEFAINNSVHARGRQRASSPAGKEAKDWKHRCMDVD